MRDLYKIFDKLIEKKVHFDFQSQHGYHNFFNLMVFDMYHKQHYFHSESLGEIEASLKLVWGHLLNEAPKPKMPMPGGLR